MEQRLDWLIGARTGPRPPAVVQHFGPEPAAPLNSPEVR